MIGLMLIVAISELHPPQCDNSTCVGPTAWQLAVMLVRLGLLIVRARGIHPCNLVFGPDHFDPTIESDKRGINSFFNSYYFSFTFVVIVSVTFMMHVQSKNCVVGLAILAFLVLIFCA
jgi:hypothetical protein